MTATFGVLNRFGETQRELVVGQVVNLRGGWIPPLSRAIAAVGRLTIGRQLAKLPHERVASPIPAKQLSTFFYSAGSR